ncbi:2,3-dihydroxy-p-cumate/2,3-dihydroxybenzoate 3,4-dioxygenase [Neobacillus niacini]|uniref:VOC family protein n=1 Tax=Neobacillus niacini TaxID=86668 RepID=UPI002781BAD8|nr:VOC family protein [Neobacillus niacini]MDQ1002177.1 2,3-dihydroxy-p-cumate/2,3-dihydroxybenzoate 3,4-dioxygenase [Neobacillus niacini]
MIRYQKLGYVALNVTDIDQSRDFYENIVGLKLVEQSENGPVFFRCSRDHHNLVLYPSSTPGLKRVGLEVEDPEQLEIAYNHFKNVGLDPKFLDKEEQRALRQGKTFRIHDPNTQITFEFYSDITQMATEFQPTHTNIARLGHVVIKVPEFEKCLEFLTEVMNFKVSDYHDETLAWMRVFPNPYHHTFAIARGERHQLHHINFMVSDIDDVGRGRNRLIENEVPITFGPGRHGPSGSIFLYFQDPDNLTVEYSFEMEEFPEEKPRKAKLLERHPKTTDQWGGKPDPKFASFGYIEGAVEEVKS